MSAMPNETTAQDCRRPVRRVAPRTGRWRLTACCAAKIILMRAFALVCVLWALPATALERSELVIETAAGGRHPFTVEVATTPRDQARGLMWRRELAPDAGMLFVYADDRPITMWMKNTFVPLDMLFLASDGRIVRIVANTVPESLRTISSGRAVRAVLELNADTAARLGIGIGDRVRHHSLDGD